MGNKDDPTILRWSKTKRPVATLKNVKANEKLVEAKWKEAATNKDNKDAKKETKKDTKIKEKVEKDATDEVMQETRENMEKIDNKINNIENNISKYVRDEICDSIRNIGPMIADAVK